MALKLNFLKQFCKKLFSVRIFNGDICTLCVEFHCNAYYKDFKPIFMLTNIVKKDTLPRHWISKNNNKVAALMLGPNIEQLH